jgi:Trypsin-co-occurring domain 1
MLQQVGKTAVFIEPTQVPPILLSGESQIEGSEGLVSPSGRVDATGWAENANQQLTEVVASLAGELDEKLQSILATTKLTELTLEFGLSLTAETWLWLIKSSGQGTIKATLKWERGEDSKNA